MLKRAFPEYDLTWLSDEMEVSLPQELDFTQEGENARIARAYFGNVKGIPLIIPEGSHPFLAMQNKTKKPLLTSPQKKSYGPNLES